jgi:hypothetical protein
MSENVNIVPFVAPEPEAFPLKPIAQRFRFRPSAEIPARPWQYPKTFLRKYLTVTFSPGGCGKSTLAMIEACAIALDRPLMGIQPIESGPVLIFNGEDPMEELEMRLAALIAEHGDRHRFTGQDLEQNLFLNSGRDTDWIVIRQQRDGLTIAEPKVESIKDFIRENGIIHIVVDPFISTHEVSENDNPAINAAATLWVNIGHETNCSIHLIHHAKKTNGQDVSEESARGAKALTDKARITRFLQPMSDEQAKLYDINPADRFEYVRMNDGKVNLHRRSGVPSWFRLRGVPLDNGEEVQTCEPWTPPDSMDGVTAFDLIRVQAKVRAAAEAGRPLRADPQASHWVGKVIAEVLGLDLSEKQNKTRVKDLLRRWMQTGALDRKDYYHERTGREVPVVVAGGGDLPEDQGAF